MLVITDTGEQLGTMTVPEALTQARERGLDLVEVAPNAAPPVCRILDYGRLRYLYSKKEKEAKKSQKNTALREVRFRTRIGDHDFGSKIRKVRELLGDGSKVKVAVVFRGREVTHREIGVSLLKRVADVLQEDARLESPPSMEGRAMSIMLVPAVKKGDKKVAEVKSDAVLEVQAGLAEGLTPTEVESETVAEVQAGLAEAPTATEVKDGAVAEVPVGLPEEPTPKEVKSDAGCRGPRRDCRKGQAQGKSGEKAGWGKGCPSSRPIRAPKPASTLLDLAR